MPNHAQRASLCINFRHVYAATLSSIKQCQHLPLEANLLTGASRRVLAVEDQVNQTIVHIGHGSVVDPYSIRRVFCIPSSVHQVVTLIAALLMAHLCLFSHIRGSQSFLDTGIVTGFFIPKHSVAWCEPQHDGQHEAIAVHEQILHWAFISIAFSRYFLICNIYPILSAEAKAMHLLLIIIAALNATLMITFQVHCEVGMGAQKELHEVQPWYEKVTVFHIFSAASHIPASQASEHGNTDATQHLCILSQAAPQPLSHVEHNVITEDKLSCKRMQAKQCSNTMFEATQQKQQQPPQVQLYHAPRLLYMCHGPPPEVKPQPDLHMHPDGCAAMELVCKSSLLDMGHYQQGSMGTAVFDYHVGYGSPPPMHANANGVPNRGHMLPVVEHLCDNILLPVQRPLPACDNTLPLHSSACAGTPGEQAASAWCMRECAAAGAGAALLRVAGDVCRDGFTDATGATGSAQTLPKLRTD
ncbi:hypothetical protein B0H10DRAFT_1956700 [Mycena sp. CBHHK59/15]|nr:hypothetical protein B0H10DRAFT_1956700 [Mycena sp. CBHHK59/15]